MVLKQLIVLVEIMGLVYTVKQTDYIQQIKD